MKPAVCPKCGRPNAGHRAACLYCGATMPAPVPRPAPAPLPPDFDALARAAMAGTGVDALRRALEAARDATPPPATSPAPAPAAPAPAAPAPAVPAPVGSPALASPPPSASPPSATTPSASAPSAAPPASSAPPVVPVAPEPPRHRGAPTGGDPLSALLTAAHEAILAQARGDDAAVADALGRADVAVRASLKAHAAGRLPRAASAAARGMGAVGRVEPRSGGEEPTRRDPGTPGASPDLPVSDPSPEPPEHAALGSAPDTLPEVLPEVLPDVLPDTLVEPLPPAIRLPPARHPYALALGPIPLGTDASVLASALAVDLVTARNAARSGGPRVVLRAPDRADLDRRAARATAAGLSVRVHTRDDLLAAGPAWAVVRLALDGAWRVVAAPLWEERPDPGTLPDGEPVELGEVWSAVVGEVEERRTPAAAAESRWQRARYAPNVGAGGEGRVAVVDLHTAAGIYRICEGLTDLRALPGADPSSQRRSIHVYIDGLAARWPAARIEGRRVCAAEPRPGAPRADGWATWEEHTRVCRLLLGKG